jgi:hypothetical protein
MKPEFVLPALFAVFVLTGDREQNPSWSGALNWPSPS